MHFYDFIPCRHPKDNELSGSLEIPIQPPKDISVDLHVKAFVGNKQTKWVIIYIYIHA